MPRRFLPANYGTSMQPPFFIEQKLEPKPAKIYPELAPQHEIGLGVFCVHVLPSFVFNFVRANCIILTFYLVRLNRLFLLPCRRREALPLPSLRHRLCPADQPQRPHGLTPQGPGPRLQPSQGEEQLLPAPEPCSGARGGGSGARAGQSSEERVTAAASTTTIIRYFQGCGSGS